MIDTKFNMQSDARGGDPDSTSPTLKSYHKILWNKPLPNGNFLNYQIVREGHIYTITLK